MQLRQRVFLRMFECGGGIVVYHVNHKVLHYLDETAPRPNRSSVLAQTRPVSATGRVSSYPIYDSNNPDPQILQSLQRYKIQ